MNVFNNSLRRVLARILFGTSLEEIRRRIVTNQYLTLSKIGRRDCINNVEDLVEKNIATILADRLTFTRFAFSLKKEEQLLAEFLTPAFIARLDSAVPKNKGVIMFTNYTGPFYKIPGVLCLIGYQVTVLTKLNFVGLHLMKRKKRRVIRSGVRFDIELLDYRNGYPIRRLVRDLNSNRVVFMRGDCRVSTERREGHTSFLGHNIKPVRTIAWLSKVTGAPIFPVMFNFGSGSIPHLEVLDEIKSGKSATVDEITQAVYMTIENQILLAPEKWNLWMDYHCMLSSNK